jgi:predicted Rdx family selenoprotein
VLLEARFKVNNGRCRSENTHDATQLSISPSLPFLSQTQRHTTQATMASTQSAPVALPRVAITYCTQCRWLLRAAYFGQELLSTFGNQIGEIALIPATGGLFTVELVSSTWLWRAGGSWLTQLLRRTYHPRRRRAKMRSRRKCCFGIGKRRVDFQVRMAHGVSEIDAEDFAETKVLKQLVRDHIDPSRDLGHSDKHGKKKEDQPEIKIQERAAAKGSTSEYANVKRNPDGTICEDCR